MKVFFSALIASFFLFLSFAFADGEFDSMQGRTQLEIAGYASYNTYNSLSWSAAASGYYYFAPHFGLGGTAGLSRYSTSDAGVFYDVGPALEYFVPVGERGHIFSQLGFLLRGSQNGSSLFSLTGRLGYRYFVSEDIALSASLYQTWSKANREGASTSTGDLSMILGFSLFF